MPAVRSRTENWKRSLQQIADKGGSIELALPRYIEGTPEGQDTSEQGGKNIVWRVRVHEYNDQHIIIDTPSSLGQTFNLNEGIDLVGIIVIGQNRWMFRTKLIKNTQHQLQGNTVPAMAIASPHDVERCQRRNFYRVRTVGLDLPCVQVYPLHKQESATKPENLSSELVLDRQRRGVVGAIGGANTVEQLPMPEVGPSSDALLLNVGGGGVGLMIEQSDAGVLEHHRLFWLSIQLPPYLPAPLRVCARLKHTHMDASQRVYAGLQFDFGHNPSHEKFVVDQLCRYVAMMQREQLGEEAENVEDEA